jgi:adenosylcobyric acid synthase
VRGGIVVCGATSDAGKSWVVTGLCRLLARQGVRVAPFKAQNMALNASVTADGAEIGHAQWIQAVAAGAEPEAAMNPVLLKPTGDRSSQVVVMGRAVGVRSAAEYHDTKAELWPVVLDALADLRSRYDVVICEGAGGAAEINLLDQDMTNLPLAVAAGLPAVVVGDIDRGGVFASLYGTVMLLPEDLRAAVRGFLVNRFRGDPALLFDACGELERRCGVPTLGVIPMVTGTDLDAEDSLALDHWATGGLDAAAAALGRPDGATAAIDLEAAVLDVAVVRFPRIANFGDADPLRLEPAVSVRWVRSVAELGRPDLVILPGSKSTVDDLAWFRATGLAGAVRRSRVPVVAVCAGLQMLGDSIDDPAGVEAAPGVHAGLRWMEMTSDFAPDKVLDRPAGQAVSEPGEGERFAGYRIHHGRIKASAWVRPWLVADGGEVLGWKYGDVLGTNLHALFEDDGLRAAVLRWAAERSALRAGFESTATWRADAPGGSGVSFAGARQARLNRIADTLAEHVDVDALFALVEQGDRPVAEGVRR